MRSKLTNDIFQDELLHLYKQKDLSYQEVRDAAHEAMGRLIRNMESGIYDYPVVEDKLVALAETLQNTKGKKVYGYLKKSIKAQVDAIVDELAQFPAVAECYEVWNKLRDEVESYYKDIPRERLPLSQQKEFKAIKNLVIREAERIRLGEITFEDEQMDDELDDEETVPTSHPRRQMVNTYQKAKYVLCDDDSTWAEQEEAVHTLEQLWNDGFTAAAHQLGKCWRDGLGILPDDDKAELWFRRSAKAGNDFSQYALGRQDCEQAYYWFSQSASQGNEYAQFFLDRWDSLKPPSIMISVSRLLHHMGRIFQDQAPALSVPGGVRIDRKRLQQLREKKIAMGHKPDDHGETQTGMTMGGM